MPAYSKELMDGVDHAWLRMEGTHNLMMIGAVLMFEGKLELEQLRQVIQSRLVDKFDRFSQRVIHENGHDYWETDPYFDLDNHILPVGFPHDGDKKALQLLAGKIVSTPLEFDKPLWSMHVVSHYQTGSALIIRIHHCIADGMSLVRLIISLTDNVADPRKTELCMNKPTGGAGSHHQHHTFWESFKQTVSGAEELTAVTLRLGDPKTGLKGELSGQKTVSWADPFPLADVKKISKTFHTTINDTLMAAAAGGLRTHLLRQGELVKGKTIHAAVPFNLRAADAPIEQLGNQFGLVLVPLPIGIEDPLERLKAVKQEMEKLKHSYQAHVFFFLLQLLGKGPSVLEQTALEVLSKKASLVMTNVPGPKQPLYLAGTKITQPLAWVPQSGDIGLGLSILSYNDTVQFGFIADQNLVSDADEVADLFIAEFRILEMLINKELKNAETVN